MSGFDESRLPKWLRKSTEPTSVKKKSQKAERVLAKALSMRATPGSGNKFLHPGDIAGKGFRIEHKMTEKSSISIKGEWLDKIRQEAISKGDIPALALKIGEREEWVMIDLERFKLLIAFIDTLED
jgi:Holliday junction resolvase